jgi:hypothetical protein
MKNLPAHTQDHPRVVVFMTHERPSDVPGNDHALACLLPLGTASFAERLMDSCALAGIRQLDVVVSDYPEAIRSLLKDGAPWGIEITWHHAKESTSPYKVLRGMALKADQRVVLGHAHHWVSSRILRELVQEPGVAIHVAYDLEWTGWFSADAATATGFGPHSDYESLEFYVRSLSGPRSVIATPSDHAQCLCAKDLLKAQQLALEEHLEAAIPASWRRMPWGAVSTDAFVAEGATIHGPVLIGPGSVVEAGAEVGPDTVLMQEVVVASGARIKNTLVMSNTFVGGQIDLENAIAQGNSVQSLHWAVRTVLSPEDGMLLALRRESSSRTPWLSRATAALVITALSALILTFLALYRVLFGRIPWRNVLAVQSRSRNIGEEPLIRVPVRLAHSQKMYDRYGAYIGGLLDIVQGRRSWFGMRPRIEVEWYSLGRDWQTLFSRTPIGLFHAAAWADNTGSPDSEAHAAADAYMAVQSSMATRFKILCASAWTRQSAFK